MLYNNKQTITNLNGLKERLKEAVYERIACLDAVAWISREPVDFEQRNQNGTARKIAIGEKWGEIWDCAWFNFKGIIPETARGKKVVLMIDLSGEGCVFDADGCPVRGITNVSSHYDFTLGMPGKRILQFSDCAEGGEQVDIWVDAGCNDLFGMYKGNGQLKEAHIAICNESIRQLYYDFSVLLDLLGNLPEDGAGYSSLLSRLNQAAVTLNTLSDKEVEAALAITGVELESRNDIKGASPSLSINAIGHAHIDLAWLWPVRETIRKGARTFSTALEMLKRYPDYVFGASQPQLYSWIKERYPLLYEKIKLRVKEGRWEVQGAMWVEPDTNIPSGESLVRQILYGKRFFKEEFGIDVRMLWLPDVFGYSGALPQILKKSGVEYFLTIKLSWNMFNSFPYHTFQWEGIDGSRILSHMPPEGTYNSAATPSAIMKTIKNFKEKGISDEAMMLFGIGDGGGGPGPEHLERLEREKDLVGLVPVRQGKAIDFFKRIEKDSDKYNTWVGELYLEKHQGTYTSQAKNKWYNRKIEIALREVEFSLLLANLCCGSEYSKSKLEELWKEVLLYQFHDILPGSSIKRVYDESLERYGHILGELKGMIDKSYREIACSIGAAGCEKSYAVFNSLSWDRDEWLMLDGNWVKAHVPSMGYTVIEANSLTADNMADLSISDNCMENEFLNVKFDEDGSISSIYDKENGREVIIEGDTANKLWVYEDTGDAWDININYDKKQPEKLRLVSRKAFIDGPRVVMRMYYEYGISTLNQDVVLFFGDRRLYFQTVVNWQETGKMLRTAFPVDVHSSEATYNIQFGNIKRPTHTNTSWDMARFEVCAHKWADISQQDYGVALINDCKYGYKVRGSVLDLNLLRSTNYPGEGADKGLHEFSYALYPHRGNEIAGDVAKKAYEMNIPMNTVKLEAGSGVGENGGTPGIRASFFSIDAGNVVLETVKRAEDGKGLILRLYENSGCNASASININMKIKSVQLVDLMEAYVADTGFNGNKIKLSFKPYEIHTLKVEADLMG